MDLCKVKFKFKCLKFNATYIKIINGENTDDIRKNNWLYNQSNFEILKMK